MTFLRVRLRSKLLLAFALVLLPVLVLLWVDFRASLMRQDRSILGDQLLTAQAIALQVDEAFDSLIGLAWAVAGDPVVRAGQDSALDARLVQVAAHLPHAEFIAVYDEKGDNRGWAGAGEAGRSPANIGEHPEFRSAMATSIPQISEVLTLERVGLPGIVALVPILDAGDRPVGVVAVGASADQLSRRYANARLLPGQSIFLADRDGRLAFHTGHGLVSHEESTRLAASPPLRTALAGIPVTQSRFAGLLGEERLAAFAPSHKYRWVVGVTVSRALALAPIERAFRAELGAFAVIMIASLALAVVLARYLVNPVRRLEGAAVALGHGDLTRRVRIESSDELGLLGAAFNTMAGQLTRLYDEQRTMLRLREDFMQAAAHELKTPLSTITSSLHLALAQPQTAAGQHALEIIVRQANRMALLVEDLLTVTRLQGAAPDLQRQRGDLSALVEDTVRRTAAQEAQPDGKPNGRHAIAVSAASAGPLVIEADPELVGLALARLLENAVVSSPEGAAIEVVARREGHEAVVCVIDHGPGVPAARRPHVFEPFYEPVPSGEDGYVGVVSLRLYVCKRILDAHGGRIWMASTADGGSTFSFALPLAEAHT